jgi:hypothetical protein
MLEGLRPKEPNIKLKMPNNFFDKAKSWFSGKKETEPEALETAEAPPFTVQPEKPAVPEAAQSATGNDPMQVRQHVHGEEDPNYYFWLKNDGLLRDEGVLFGMASDDPAPKLDVIRAYFNEKGSILQKKIAFLDQNIEILRLKKEKEEEQLKDKDKEVNQIQEKTYVPVNPLGKYALFLIFICIAVLNFLLIKNHLEPVWRDMALLLSAGIYLFGMITVYQDKSILFNHNGDAGTNSEKPEKWKLWLQEFGVPCAVVVFIGSTTYRVYDPSYQFGVLFMEAIFFLLFGKGIMRQYQQLFEVRRNNLLLKIEKLKNEKKLQELEGKVQDGQKQLSHLETELNRMHLDRQKQVENLSEVEQKRETACRLFLSEFFLAVSARAN